MAGLKGYRYLGKERGERYLTPSGEEISKRQYRNRVLKKEGIADNLSQWENATQDWANERRKTPKPEYELFSNRVDRFSKVHDLSEKESRKAIAQYTKQGRKEKWKKDPDGALAKLLEDLEYRDPGADYNVGDTP